MDAFRFEQKTGQLVGGKSHSIKLLNYRTRSAETLEK